MVGAESEHDLQAQQDVEALSLQIDDQAEIALFLDLDGTLLDIAAAPRDVSAPAGLSATLQRLQRTLSGAVAILTGRTMDQADRLLSPLKKRLLPRQRLRLHRLHRPLSQHEMAGAVVREIP
jgi:hypothetical protein